MGNTLERIHLPSKKDSNERYFDPAVPVLVEGFVSSWPALGKWTPEYLAAHWSERKVPVVTMRDGNYTQGEQKDMRLGDFLNKSGVLDEASSDSANGTAGEHSEYTHYLAQVSLSKYFPELLEDIVIPPYFPTETERSTVIYFGGTLFSQLHYHPFGSATLGVLYGEKRVRLFAPDQGHLLYSNSWRSHLAHVSKTHHKDPDPVEYPKFAQAEYIDVTVMPGEMLFIPIYWWHSIENIGASVSVTSFWEQSWMSRFVPPPGPRGSYFYEPVRKCIGFGKNAIKSSMKAAGIRKNS